MKSIRFFWIVLCMASIVVNAQQKTVPEIGVVQDIENDSLLHAFGYKGSSGSRRIPDGYDRATARKQFISIGKRIASVASKYNIIVALESLNTSEANFITTVSEALDVVKAVDHKNLRLCVDIYHMSKDNESPGVIAETKGYVVYCELAEREGRTPPGTHGDDFRPYLKMLKEIGYNGIIVIECRWDKVRPQGKPAYDELRRQLLEVY